MKIYLVIIEDRHTDVDVIPFLDEKMAVDYAKAAALAYCHDPEDFEEEDIEGWLYYARYSSEGDCVRVIESEVTPCPN